jgi:hypothetical protein
MVAARPSCDSISCWRAGRRLPAITRPSQVGRPSFPAFPAFPHARTPPSAAKFRRHSRLTPGPVHALT